MIKHNKPCELSPNVEPDFMGSISDSIANDITNILIKPLYTPSGTTPVKINRGKTNITDTDMLSIIADVLDGVSTNETNKFLLDTYKEAMIYGTNTMMDYLYVSQSTLRAKLPMLSPTILYTPSTDIIPVSKKYISGSTNYDEFFATFANFTDLKTLAIAFKNNDEFSKFKEYVSNELVSIYNTHGVLAPDDAVLFSDLNLLTLDELSEIIILRDENTPQDDEKSFARILHTLLVKYATTVAKFEECTLLPFSTSELIFPKSITFINVEKHSKAKPSDISTDWKDNKSGINGKIKTISKTKLKTLKSAQRAMQKTLNSVKGATNKANGDIAKSKKERFTKGQISSMDLSKALIKIFNHTRMTTATQNSSKVQSQTFMKPNRRRPDDINAIGKNSRKQYRPDFHIYLDTSGSVSEENYQSTIKMLIKLAKKLNINIYFNSFSTVLSSESLLLTENRSAAQIYRQFHATEKVTGGTDFSNVWAYINASEARKKRISLLITDFEYSPQNTRKIEHPKNLYYAPLTNMYGGPDRMCFFANEFISDMAAGKAYIRNKILMG